MENIYSEKSVENYLRKKIKMQGGKCFKFISPGNAGVQDRIVILPGGKVYFIELKKPGKKLRELQEHNRQELLNLGCNAIVLDSITAIDDFIHREVN